VDGDPDNQKWVIHGCTWQQYPSAYLVGSFDGSRFTPQTDPLPAHYGPCFYASQVFSHAPGDRRIMIGWLRGAAYPDMPFSQGMTVPLELSLRTTPAGLRLCFNPVQELIALSWSANVLQSITLAQANEALAATSHELLDLELRLIPDVSRPLVVNVRGETLSYDPNSGSLSFAGSTAPVTLQDGRLDLRLLVDRSVMEVFAGRGEAAFAALTIFPEDHPGIRLEGCGKVDQLTIHSLKSIWS
jgi:sucrose-6-phosphate hydrolase SacC (GH32 family)